MPQNVITKSSTGLFLILLTAMLSACNTMEGAGEDIEKGGRALKNEAGEHK